ncbi:serine/threonine-protein kinase [Paenibacillus arenilitoris]|uniref:Serine/threonine protein kinase n=1 Tax=Paenibacillus arenilitoris TaxID=2772299 RepID=A0A927CKN3_9BACL|nr:serine/threonine-protein kinase [Paenibacillus arenilitoris]MBD2869804.1 serine/threonine protein kinase [Paenibacillus arenilitoris]
MDSRQEEAVPTLGGGVIVGGRYRVAGMIGRGGMGTVYAMEDMKLGGMLRAVKVTRLSPDANEAYSAEAHMLMSLSHPNLPHIVDYLRMEESGCDALVMDYFNGQTLTAYANGTYGSIPYGQIVQIGLQLCSALRYLHRQSPPVIHRDLKPSNVMIGGNGEVKLIDFGISRRYKENRRQDTEQLGTEGFAAPEQKGGGQSDARTDIYGLGAVLFYLASGGAVFRHGEGAASDPFAGMRADIPPRFKAVVERMLQSQPSRRYPSMAEAEEALALLIHGEMPFLNQVAPTAKAALFPAGQIQIGVVSLSPGAGATFLTFALHALFGHAGSASSAVEYTGSRPEWHAVLSRHLRLRNAPYRESRGFDDRYTHVWRQDGKLSWFAIDPARPVPGDHVSQKFDQMLRQSGSSVHLFDFSSRWDEPDAMHRLLQSHIVIAVGDPAVHKWQPAMLGKLERVKEELRGKGGMLVWAANKDIRFGGRHEWLSLFPDRPLAVIPQLPPEHVWDALWDGRWVTGQRKTGKRLARALQPILTFIANGFNTK